MPAAETAKVIALLVLDDKLSPGLKKAHANVAAFEGVVQKSKAGVGQAAANIAKLGAVAAVAAGGGIVAATRAAIDFEDAFAGIRKTVDEAQLREAGLTFEDLSDDIRKMAREIPVAAVELAAIGEAAGALGIRAQDITDFTAVVAKLSVTTDLTSETAATALGQLGTTLQLTGDEFTEFADTLVALGNAGASTESQIIDIASRFAAAGNSAGLSKEDVLALSSAVASMGIDAEAGGSSLSRVFNNVATGIGTSSKEAEAFAKALGLSAKDFRKAWEKDALGTFEDFLQKLNTLDQFEQASLLEKVGITGVRDVQAVRLMAQNVGFVNEQLEISRTATGALGEEASKKFATTANQIKLLKQNLTDVGITIGNAVLPKITQLTQELVKFLNQPATQKQITDLANKLPPLVDEIASIVRGVPWASVGDAMRLAGVGAKAIYEAFKAMPAWVQTAVITGWGLNKLTGGALTGIIGELGKGLIKGVLGINAGVVNIKAGAVTGAGGVGGAAGTGAKGTLGRIASAATKVFLIGAAAGIIAELAGALAEQSAANKEQIAGLSQQNALFVKGATLDDQKKALAGIDAEIARLNSEMSAEALAFGFNIDGVRDAILAERERLAQSIASQETTFTIGWQKVVTALGGLANPNRTKDDRFNPQASREGSHASTRLTSAELKSFRDVNVTNADLKVLPQLLSFYQTSVHPNEKSVATDMAALKTMEAQFLATGDTKNAAIVTAGIATLQGVLNAAETREANKVVAANQAAAFAVRDKVATGTAAMTTAQRIAADRTATASRAAGVEAATAIRNKDLSVEVNVPPARISIHNIISGQNTVKTIYRTQS